MKAHANAGKASRHRWPLTDTARALSLLCIPARDIHSGQGRIGCTMPTWRGTLQLAQAAFWLWGGGGMQHNTADPENRVINA